MLLAAALLCASPWVIDGDSIRCRGPDGYVGEVRLLGIDTADYTFSAPCRGHFGDHVCDDHAAKMGKQSLMRLILPMRRKGTAVMLEPVTHDRYGRLVASASVGGVNVSCYQLRAAVARYIVKYDNGKRIAKACPDAAR